MLWNQALCPDRKVTADRQDITIKTRKKERKKTCTLIDVAIPKNRNVLQREEEKKLKYKSLCIETRNVEPEISYYTSNKWSHRNSNKMLEETFGSHTRKTSIEPLQKTAILGTSHIMRKVGYCSMILEA